MVEIRSEAELMELLDPLGDIDEKTRNLVVCAILGHSKIQTHFLGYYYCARCGAQVGDTLGGSYDNSGVVIVGHGCDKCKENFQETTWKDRVFAPDPFAEESEAPDRSEENA
jgi:ribosomal protein L37AE/L43A